MYLSVVAASSGEIVSLAIGIGTVLGGMGYAAGQFFSSRRKGLSDSLATALNEIELLNRVVTRLETELHSQATDLAALKVENATLRSAIGDGAPLVEAIEKAREDLEGVAHAEHEKTRDAIRRIREDRS